MKPFFQGKIDVFCALYAVLNGLKVTHQIRTLQARDIFHETLLGISQNPKVFKAILEQKTDYIALVDAMLNIQAQKLSLTVERPFEGTQDRPPSPAQFWQTVEEWLAPNVSLNLSTPSKSRVHRSNDISSNNMRGRAVIFRFIRYLMPHTEPVNRHWTTAYYINDDVLYFFDCSLEESAIYNVKEGAFVTDCKNISTHCLHCIEPHSLRLLAPRIPTGLH